jgi:FkbM family methyltransferase
MSIRTLSKLVLKHPLNQRSGRTSAALRILRWQLAQRLMPVPMAVPFVGDSHLILTKGLFGATGNWYAGLHESNEMGFALHLLRPGDLFGDIGSNVGSYTILAAAGVGANVVAVEAYPPTFERLTRNIAFNGVQHLVDARCTAVSSKVGTLRFSTSYDAMNHVMGPDEPGEFVETPMVRLDDVIGDRSPTLLKIDVEGHELPVLLGAPKTLANPSLMAVIMEINGLGSMREGVSDDEIIALMKGNGFSPYNYDCLARKLGPPVDPSNTIFVRDPEAVDALCRSAPRYRLCNGEI